MTVVTQQKLLLDEMLGRFYHASISKDYNWTPEKSIEAIKTMRVNMAGMEDEFQARLQSLERFERETGGNLRNRCHISYLHLDCLRKVLS